MECVGGLTKYECEVPHSFGVDGAIKNTIRAEGEGRDGGGSGA